MKLTEAQRRILLDLLDEEHSRDVRTRGIGRTTAETFVEQTQFYRDLRRELVLLQPDVEYLPTPPDRDDIPF